MKIYLKKSYLLFSFILYSILSFSQLVTNELPISYIRSDIQDHMNVIYLTPPDIEKLLAEDAINDTIPGKLLRVAVPIKVNINSELEGSWETLSNGDLLWRLTFQVDGAKSLDLTFDRFWLPDEGKFFLYATGTKQVIGAITSNFLQGDEKNPANFSTGLIYGDLVTLEYYQPSHVSTKPIISISNIYYGYRYTRAYDNSNKDFGDSGDCQVNINCSEGQNWQNQKRAVARIYVKLPYEAGWCTGALINNSSNNNEPLFLTANHCMDGYFDAISNPNLSDWIFYWDYELLGCDNSNTEPTIKSTVGATVLANNSSSDFALFELTQDPRNLSCFEPFYLGWDRSSVQGAGGVGIHHPVGDVKKIATYNITPSSSDCFYSGGTNFWKINWQSTLHGWSVTEGGSSGSPLLNNNQRVIGQLFGAALCSNPNCTNPSQDIGNYGKFNISWTGNGATDSRRRLKDWLDPSGSRKIILDGIYKHSISGSYVVCSSGTTYTLSNTSSIDSLKWLCGSFLTITSGQGTSACTIAATGSGSTWISATIYYCGNSITLPQKTVWAGAPPTFDISGPASIVLNSTEHYTADVTYGELATYGVNYYDWTVTSKLQFESSHAYQIDVYVKGITLGFGTISFYTTNSCGTSTFNFPVRVVSSKSLNIYPNPAISEITIEIKDDSKVDDTSDDVAVKEQMTEEEYMVTIYDNLGILVYSNRYSNINEIKINTSGWQEGIYYVTLINGNEKYTGSFIIE